MTRPGGEHRGDWKVAQGSKPLTIKDHVVLIINSACQGSKVCSTTAGARAVRPTCKRPTVAGELNLQLMATEPEPGQLPDLFVQLLVKPHVCRHLI